MERRILVRHGEPVTVTPKALDILLFFVQNKGKVLGKDEFMKVLWPQSFVEEGNLSQHVFLLRKILGDGLNGDRFIMTIPRRGYMFVAPVREIDSTTLQDESGARIHSKRSSQPPAVLGGPHLSDRNEQSKVELDVVLQEEAGGTGNLSTNREDVMQQETERNHDSFRSVRVGEDDESINKIAALVCKGRCILVLGAAVHDPPPEGSEYSYPENERPLLGHELAQYLASKSDFIRSYPSDDPNDLQKVALHYEIRESRTALVTQINSAVHAGRRPSLVLQALATLNFPIVITTNYDRLFEKAAQGLGKDPVRSIYKKNGDAVQAATDEYPGDEDPSAERPFILKIHGDADHPESLVITDEDYIHFVLRMSDKAPFHPIPETIQYRLKQWTSLFIGFNLMDYNLRLLFQTMRWKVDPSRWPQAYSVDRAPDPLIFDVWNNQRKYVKYIQSDLWSFVSQLYQKVTGKVMQ